MLITFLLLSAICRKENEPMEEWTPNDWLACLAASFFWPIGILCLLCVDVWPELIKERKI